MSEPRTLKILANGVSGTGKSTFACSFPKIGYISTEPNALDCTYTYPKLRENIVEYQEFLPSITEDIKLTFDRLDAYVLKLHQLGKEKKIETLVLDNLTFLSLNRWLFIDKYERQTSSRTGEIDTRGMYGALGNWLYRFSLLYLVSFPGNVVITAHIQRDDENDLKASLTPTAPITADVLGKMRYRITGLVSASIFLHRKKVMLNGKPDWSFYARTIEGEGELAKSRYPLKEIVENISYDSIMKELNGQVGSVARTPTPSQS
jgi:hypothetical protein